MICEKLKSLIEYRPDDGVFVWKSVRKHNRLWRVAGTLRNDGYWSIMILGKSYFAHRLAFLYMTDAMPIGEIDHINGDRSDNRWCNLRQCSRAQNRMNLKVYKNSTTQVAGVSWHKRLAKWQARIGQNGKRIHLGYFDVIEGAIEARLLAQRLVFGEFARMI